MALEDMRSPIESGCPDGFQYMHPTMRKNFGQWKYHELQTIPRDWGNADFRQTIADHNARAG